MTMIPTSYLSKTLYAETWGDPRNSHAVDIPAVPQVEPHGAEPAFNLLTLASTLRQRLVRHQPVVDDCSAQSCA